MARHCDGWSTVFDQNGDHFVVVSLRWERVVAIRDILYNHHLHQTFHTIHYPLLCINQMIILRVEHWRYVDVIVR